MTQFICFEYLYNEKNLTAIVSTNRPFVLFLIGKLMKKENFTHIHITRKLVL